MADTAFQSQVLELAQDTPYSSQLMDTVTGGAPAQATAVTLHLTSRVLHVRFVCEDTNAWSTFTERDEPLFEQEAVEVFIGPGMGDTKAYFEFEVSPEGVLWDGVVWSPNLCRRDMVSDPRWDSDDVQWGAMRHFDRDVWEAWVSIDLDELYRESLRLGFEGVGGEFPADWRLNLYRIDRPEGAPAEYTALAPTLADPADFHVPQSFLLVQLEA